MKLNYFKGKIIITVLVILLFFSLFINYNFKLVLENLISSNIVDLKIETFFANSYAKSLLDTSLEKEVKNNIIINLTNNLNYISIKLPSIYKLYYNDKASNSLSIQFNTEIDKFSSFLDKNKDLIITNSLDSDKLDILNENASKLKKLDDMVEKLSRYSDGDKKYNLTLSLLFRNMSFKKLLQDTINIYTENQTE